MMPLERFEEVIQTLRTIKSKDKVSKAKKNEALINKEAKEHKKESKEQARATKDIIDYVIKANTENI